MVWKGVEAVMRAPAALLALCGVCLLLVRTWCTITPISSDKTPCERVLPGEHHIAHSRIERHTGDKIFGSGTQSES